jgi:hypothetical protein
MTYAELTALLQDYTQNTGTEFVAAIPNIVQLAEDRIYLTINLPVLNKSTVLTLSNGVRTVTLPSDFLSANSVAVVSGGIPTYLLERDPAFIAEAFPNSATTGAPRYYALFNNNTFQFGPTPGSGYTLDLYYVYSPPSIVTAGTSWLGDNAESILFYGALTEAYVYMKGDPQLMSVYASRYNEGLGRLKDLGEAADKRDQFKIDAPRSAPT